MKGPGYLSLTMAMILFLLTATALSAGDHIVPRNDLNQAVQQKADQRRAETQKIRSFFESDVARKALEKTSIDPQQITAAVPLLDDAELSRLADQVDRLQTDIHAGALTNQQITYILIALGTAVIVLILVAD